MMDGSPGASSSSSASSAPTGSSSIKLLSSSRKDGLSLHPAGLELISSQRSSACLLVSIVGEARTGKSFLLNCLAQDEAAFKVDNRSTCTLGVDVYPRFLSMEKLLAAHHLKDERRSSARVGFLDVEGTGHHSAEYDVKLVLPPLLASEVIIYNIKGQALKSKLLNQLATLSKAASKIAKEEAGGSKRKGAEGEEPTFGHLHLVCRDWTFALSAKEMEEILWETEDPDAEDEEEEEVLQRNLLRQRLRKNFRSISIHLLPIPTANTEIMSQTSIPFGKVDTAFGKGVKKLAESIFQQLEQSSKERRSFNGYRLAARISSIAQQVNQNGKVKIGDLLTYMQQEEVRQVMAQALKSMEVRVKDVESLLPLSMAMVQKTMENMTTEIGDAYQKQLGEDIPSTMRTQHWEEVKHRLKEQHSRLEQLNQSKIQDFRSLLSEKEEGALTALESYCSSFSSKSDVEGHIGFAKSLMDKHLQQLTKQVSTGAAFLEEGFGKQLLERVRHKMNGLLEKHQAELKSQAEAAIEAAHLKVLEELEKDFGSLQFQSLPEMEAKHEKIFNAAMAPFHQVVDRSRATLKGIGVQSSVPAQRTLAIISRDNHLFQEKKQHLEQSKKLEEALAKVKELESRPARRVEVPVFLPSFGGGFGYDEPPARRSSYGGGGGGRRSSSSSSSKTFYAGGQFVPGGGRAPRGGMWK
ncbi:hypothetical protein QOT17_003812 [Balamuthia mandrillaris]